MFKNVIFGILGFAAAFTASQQLAGVGKDIARYNRIRAMSGDPPFAREQLGTLLQEVRKRAFAPRAEGRDIFSALLNDVTRYARIRSM